MLSVKAVTLGVISSVHGPHALDIPSSGLNDQRLLPRVKQFAVVVLPQQGRHLQAYSDNEVLLFVVRKLLH